MVIIIFRHTGVGGGGSLKEITSQTDECLVNLSSKTYVFENKMTKY